MKIASISIQVLEIPEQRRRIHELVQVPSVRRIQYTHRSKIADSLAQIMIMRVMTDEGVEGLCTIEGSIGDATQVVELLRANVLGEDVSMREHIFQKLQLGTRWVYQRPGWFGALDNCLWDVVGKAAGLPIYELVGRVRDGVPIYQTAGDGPLETYIEHIERGLELGIRAYKPHSYLHSACC